DSSPFSLPVKHLKIVDSTTISLFSDILKGVGRNPVNGKKKGGIKMHTKINALEDVPCLIRFSSAATHDHTFLKELNLCTWFNFLLNNIYIVEVIINNS